MRKTVVHIDIPEVQEESKERHTLRSFRQTEDKFRHRKNAREAHSASQNKYTKRSMSKTETSFSHKKPMFLAQKIVSIESGHSQAVNQAKVQSMLGSIKVSIDNKNIQPYNHSKKECSPFKDLFYSKIKEHNSYFLTKRYMFASPNESNFETKSRKNSVKVHPSMIQHYKFGQRRKTEGNIRLKENDKGKYWEPIHRGFKKYMIHSKAKYNQKEVKPWDTIFDPEDLDQ